MEGNSWAVLYFPRFRPVAWKGYVERKTTRWTELKTILDGCDLSNDGLFCLLETSQLVNWNGEGS
jgi:hypothetical protein